MQQSSATQSLHLSFWGLRKIVACSHSSSQCLLVSTVFGTVSSLHPTSFLMIFILVHISDVGIKSWICNRMNLGLVQLFTHTYWPLTLPTFHVTSHQSDTHWLYTTGVKKQVCCSNIT